MKRVCVSLMGLCLLGACSGSGTSAPSPATQSDSAGALWSGGIVPYTLDPSLAATERLRVLSAINHYHETTAVRFLPRTKETDYVTFQSDPQSVCEAEVGRRGGQQFVRIGETCSFVDILHEIGHTLGRTHEHQRGDRDAYVTVLTENILPGHTEEFEPLDGAPAFQEAYDIHSIMHYGPYAFSRDPGSLPTLKAKDGGTVGPRGGFSRADIARFLELYPF